MRRAGCSLLELDNVSYAVTGKTILREVSCQFKAGTLTAIIGPNGAGKTTCLRVAAGIIAPTSGMVRAADFDNLRARARMIAYLPQFQNIAWPLLCRDVVALGLLAHDAYGTYGRQADDLVMAALAKCDATQFADRPIDTLSGGEKARVLLARLLVGGAPVLLLDEPVQSLDAAGALSLMQLLRREADAGAAVGVVMHDINLARQFCDEALVMHKGVLVAQGAADEVFTPARLGAIFGVEFDAIDAPDARYLMPRQILGN